MRIIYRCLWMFHRLSLFRMHNEKIALLEKLAPFKNEVKKISDEQDTGDIEKEIIRKHKECETDYDDISEFFYNGDTYNTCNRIWTFLKNNLKYTIEPAAEQTVKSPQAILQDGAKTDCKHYALFAGGILDSLTALGYDDFDWCYRFAGYNSKAIEHVFVVVHPDTDDEIWIDPVLDDFDDHYPPYYFEDKRVSPGKKVLKNIAGIAGELNLTNTILGALIAFAVLDLITD